MFTLDQVRSAGHGKLRRINRGAILSYIRLHGPTARSELGRALSLSGAAVTSVVNDLLDEGFLRESAATQAAQKKKKTSQGRPISLLELNPNAAFALGIAIRPSKTDLELALSWVDYAGQIRILDALQIEATGSYTTVVDGVLKAIDTLKAAIPKSEYIVGATLAIPGVIEGDSIPIAPKLECLQGDAFIQAVRQATTIPISFYNDVNLATISELRQQPRLRKQCFAYLYLYSGVGSGICINGQLYTGSGGWAGEIGSLQINASGADAHTFESQLSIDGSLADLLEQLGHRRDALNELCPYIDQRHPTTIQIIDTYCERVADIIKILNSVLDLDEILIDFRSDALFTRLRPRLEILMQSAPRQPAISTPIQGRDATLNGAALTALQQACEALEEGH